MSNTRKVLEKKLEEIILPLGFKRIAKTEYYFREHGDGVYQGVTWQKVRYGLELGYWIESVYNDPDCLFRHFLINDLYYMMLNLRLINSSWPYSDDEFIPEINILSLSYDEQLNYLQQQILPRFERWNTQENVLKAQINVLPPEENIRYNYGFHRNLAFFLGYKDEAQKCIDGPLDFARKKYNDALNKDKKPIEPIDIIILNNKKKELEYRIAVKNTLADAEKFKKYIQICKEQNLKDLQDVINGKRGNSSEIDFPPYFLTVDL